MKMFHSLALLGVCLLLSGCAAAMLPMTTSLGTLLGGPPPTSLQEQTGVRLSQANFVLVKTNVVGSSKGFSLLGLITVVPATVTKATGRMYSSAQMHLGEAQTIADVMIEHSSSYWILFGIPRVDVHADIVEFRPTDEASQPVKPPPPPAKPPE